MVIVVTNVFLMLFCGMLYAWAIFVAPLEQEFGWTRSQTSLTFTLSLVFSTIAAGTASFIAKKVKPQAIVFFAAIIAGAGMTAVSKIQSLGQLYLLYGVICAVAIGFVYNLTLSNIVPWFLDKPGLITGVLLMAFGMGGMVLGSFASMIIGSFGWRTAFVVLGVFTFVIMLCFSFFVRKPNEEETMALGFTQSEVSVNEQIEHTPKMMIKTKFFMVFVLWYIPITVVGLTMASHSAPIAQAIGVTAASSAVYAGTISLCNGLGRVVFGYILDNFGKKLATYLANGIMVFGSVLLIVALCLSSKLLLFICFIAIGLSFGGGPVLSMGLVKNYFGNKYYGQNIGIANMTIIAGAVIGPYCGGLLYQASGYFAVAAALFVFAAASLVMSKKVL